MTDIDCKGSILTGAYKYDCVCVLHQEKSGIIGERFRIKFLKFAKMKKILNFVLLKVKSFDLSC